MHKRLLAMLLALTLAMTSVLPAFAETTVPGDAATVLETDVVETEPVQSPAEDTAPAEEAPVLDEALQSGVNTVAAPDMSVPSVALGTPITSGDATAAFDETLTTTKNAVEAIGEWNGQEKVLTIYRTTDLENLTGDKLMLDFTIDKAEEPSDEENKVVLADISGKSKDDGVTWTLNGAEFTSGKVENAKSAITCGDGVTVQLTIDASKAQLTEKLSGSFTLEYTVKLAQATLNEATVAADGENTIDIADYLTKGDAETIAVPKVQVTTKDNSEAHLAPETFNNTALTTTEQAEITCTSGNTYADIRKVDVETLQGTGAPVGISVKPGESKVFAAGSEATGTVYVKLSSEKIAIGDAQFNFDESCGIDASGVYTISRKDWTAGTGTITPSYKVSISGQEYTVEQLETAGVTVEVEDAEGMGLSIENIKQKFAENEPGLTEAQTTATIKLTAGESKLFSGDASKEIKVKLDAKKNIGTIGELDVVVTDTHITKDTTDYVITDSEWQGQNFTVQPGVALQLSGKNVDADEWKGVTYTFSVDEGSSYAASFDYRALMDKEADLVSGVPVKIKATMSEENLYYTGEKEFEGKLTLKREDKRTNIKTAVVNFTNKHGTVGEAGQAVYYYKTGEKDTVLKGVRVEVSLNGKLLRETTDYTVSEAKLEEEEGEVTVTVTANHASDTYCGTATATFQLKKAIDLSKAGENLVVAFATSETAGLAADGESFYQKSVETKVEPAVTVQYKADPEAEEAETLTTDDVTVTYELESTATAGEHKVTITAAKDSPRFENSYAEAGYTVVDGKAIYSITVAAAVEGGEDEVITGDTLKRTYTGDTIEPKVKAVVSNDNATLTADDYSVEYSVGASADKIKVGDATIKITGKGSNGYAEKEKSFKYTIEKYDLKNATLSLAEGKTYVYNGTAIQPAAADLVISAPGLKQDYTFEIADMFDLSYGENNTNAAAADAANAPTVTATIKGEGDKAANFTGSLTLAFEIAKYDLSKIGKEDGYKNATLAVTLEGGYGDGGDEFGYTGAAIKPAVTKIELTDTDNGIAVAKQLNEKPNELSQLYGYAVSYGENVGTNSAETPDEGEVIITGRYNFTGEYVKKIKIVHTTELTDAEAYIKLLGAENGYTYNGQEQKPTVDVYLRDGNGADKPDTKIDAKHYAVAYTDSRSTDAPGTNAGTVTVTVTGKGLKDGFGGVLTASYVIKPYTLKDTVAVTVSAEGITYDGLPHVLTADNLSSVTLTGATSDGFASATPALTFDKDYEVSIPAGSNVDAGTVVFYLVGKGNYAGEVTTTNCTFTIGKADAAALKEQFHIVNASKQYSDDGVNPEITGLIFVDKNGVGHLLTKGSEWRVASETKPGQVGATVNIAITAAARNFNAGTIEGLEVYIEPYDLSKGYIVNGENSKTIRNQFFGGTKEEVEDGVELDFAKSAKEKADQYSVMLDMTPKDKKDAPKELTVDTDYVVGYLNNTKAGKATVVVGGTGNYTGSFTKTFTIKPLDVTKVAQLDKEAFEINQEAGVYVELSDSPLTYNGSKQYPTVKVKYRAVKEGSTVELTEAAKQISVTPVNGINAWTKDGGYAASKEPYVKVKMLNGFTGTLKANYEIQPAKLSDTSRIKVEVTGVPTLNKKNKAEPAFKVIDNVTGKTIASTQYEKTYGNNEDVRKGIVATGQSALEALLETPEADFVATAQSNDVAYALVYARNAKNYTGQAVGAFNIGVSIAGARVALQPTSKTYDGEEVDVATLVTGVTLKGKELYKAEPALVKVSVDGGKTIKDADTYKIIVEGDPAQGYVGKVSATFKIKPAAPKKEQVLPDDNADAKAGYTIKLDWNGFNTANEPDYTKIPDVLLDGSDPVYTGSKITLPKEYVTVEYRKADSEDADEIKSTDDDGRVGTIISKVAFSANVKAGDAKVTVTLKGDHSGTVSRTFKIAKAKIKTVTVDGSAVATSNSAVKPKVTVADANGLVVKSGEYTLVYDHNINLAATGWNDLSDNYEVPQPIVYVVPKNKNYEADKSAEGYEESVTVGTKSYADVVSQEFFVAAKTGNVKGATLTFEKDTVEFDPTKAGNTAYEDGLGPVVTKVNIKNGSSVDFDGNFTAVYSSNTKAGTGKVTVTGVAEKGYGGTVTKTFKITPVQMNASMPSIITASMTDDNDQFRAKDGTVYAAYTGKAITLNSVDAGGKTVKNGLIQVQYKGKTLDPKKDYTVSYKDNKKVGLATVVITGKGSYTGTANLYFKIVVPEHLPTIGG